MPMCLQSLNPHPNTDMQDLRYANPEINLLVSSKMHTDTVSSNLKQMKLTVS